MAGPNMSGLEQGNNDNDIVDSTTHDTKDCAGSGDSVDAEDWPLPIRVFTTALVGGVAFVWYVQSRRSNTFILYM